MAYTYEYPRPAVTADCVVITKERLRSRPKMRPIERIHFWIQSYQKWIPFL